MAVNSYNQAAVKEQKKQTAAQKSAGATTSATSGSTLYTAAAKAAATSPASTPSASAGSTSRAVPNNILTLGQKKALARQIEAANAAAKEAGTFGTAAAGESAPVTPPSALATYIDDDGKKKTGVVGQSQSQSQTLYADAASGTPTGYTDDAGRYHTTIYGADGKTYSGYIYNGATYYDNGDRLAVGDYVYGADGTKYTMTADKQNPNPELSNGKSPEFNEWLWSDSASGAGQAITNDNYTNFIDGKDYNRADGRDIRNGSITMMPDGRIAVSDGFGNIHGVFDSAGNFHQSDEDATWNGEPRANALAYDELHGSWEKTARDYLKSIGYEFTGNGLEWKRRDHYPVSGADEKWLDESRYLKDLYSDYRFVANLDELKSLPAGTKVYWYGSTPPDESELPDGLIMRGRGNMGAFVTGDKTGRSYDFSTEQSTGLAPYTEEQLKNLGKGVAEESPYIRKAGTTGTNAQGSTYGAATTSYGATANNTGAPQTAQNTGTPQTTQQRDMIAEEAERQRQVQEQLEKQKQQQQAQIAAMTPEDNAQMKQLQDQLAQVDALLEEARAANNDAYALQLEQLRNRIQLQIDNLNEQYQGINRQLYIDYMNGRRDLPQQLAAMGYTGGLRESSLLGLQNNYEGQLAENERARLAGIREIESGGIDKELTLGIENIKDNAAQAEKAYDRSAAIRAQMLSQMNRIEDLSREDAQTARKEAQTQINAFLSAGGNAAEIPEALLNISGYSGAYVNTLAQQYQQTLARAQADAILKAGGTVPDELAAAAGYGSGFTGAMDAVQRRALAQQQADAILRAGGTVPADIAAEAGYASTYASTIDAAGQRTRAQQQIQQILAQGGVVPDSLAQAAGYSLDYTAALSSAQKQREARDQITQILSAGGTVPYSLARSAGYSTAYIDALMAAQQQPSAQGGSEVVWNRASGGLNGSSGYSTDYADAADTQTMAKPVLTVAQVNDAIERGILSDQVMNAYQYYYGTPYVQPVQAAQPTYYYMPTPTPTTEEPTTEEPTTVTPRAQTPQEIAQSYQEMLFYATEEALANGTAPADAKDAMGDYIGTDLGNKVKDGTLDRTTAIQIMNQLGLG